MNGAESRFLQKRVQLSSDQGIAPGISLEINQALDGLFCGFTVRVKICRAMVSFDDRDRTSGLNQVSHDFQGFPGTIEMFQHMTYKDVVK